MMNKIAFVLGYTDKLDAEIDCEKYINFTTLRPFSK